MCLKLQVSLFVSAPDFFNDSLVAALRLNSTFCLIDTPASSPLWLARGWRVMGIHAHCTDVTQEQNPCNGLPATVLEVKARFSFSHFFANHTFRML